MDADAETREFADRWRQMVNKKFADVGVFDLTRKIFEEARHAAEPMAWYLDQLGDA